MGDTRSFVPWTKSFDFRSARSVNISPDVGCNFGVFSV